MNQSSLTQTSNQDTNINKKLKTESNQNRNDKLQNEQEKIEYFINWFKQQGGICNIKIKDVNGSRGIYTKQTHKVQDNQPLVSVPNSLILSPKRIENSDYKLNTKYSKIFNSHPDIFDPSNQTSHSNCQSGLEMQFVFFLLSELNKKEKSFWHPFIESLPKQYYVPATHMNQNEILQWVQAKDDIILNLIKKRKQQIDKLWFQFKAQLMKYMEPQISKEQFDWALLTVQTRGFGDDFLPYQLCLMPMLDMLNHSNQQPKIQFSLKSIIISKNKQLKLNWDLNDKAIVFQICPKVNLNENEEVFDEYDKICNSKLIDMHGFCLENNQYDNYQMKIEAESLDHKKRFGRWKLDLSLKYDSLSFDLINFLKAMPCKTEKEVLQNYKKIVDNELNKYSTDLKQDQDEFQEHKLYDLQKFIILYRIGQKNILQQHKNICDQLLQGKVDNSLFQSKQMKKYLNQVQIENTIKQ